MLKKLLIMLCSVMLVVYMTACAAPKPQEKAEDVDAEEETETAEEEDVETEEAAEEATEETDKTSEAAPAEGTQQAAATGTTTEQKPAEPAAQ